MIDADMTEMDVVEIALTTAERLGQHALTWKRRLVEAEATIQRVRAVADAWEYYASENGNVRTAWAASSVREALDGDA